ncbi:MAG: UbiA family prenyltransferase, partial [Anaerolineae bacterium]
MSIGDIPQTKKSVEQTAVSPPRDWRSLLNLVIILFKIRIVFLLLMAATGGAFLAARGWPGLGTLVLLWLTGGAAASGASAINQYLDRHSDGEMKRTAARRPLVNGDIPNPGWVPWVGSLLI